MAKPVAQQDPKRYLTVLAQSRPRVWKLCVLAPVPMIITSVWGPHMLDSWPPKRSHDRISEGPVPSTRPAGPLHSGSLLSLGCVHRCCQPSLQVAVCILSAEVLYKSFCIFYVCAFIASVSKARSRAIWGC